MNLLPHVIVLSIIRKSFNHMRKDPDTLNFILGGYGINLSMTNTYGHIFTDNAVKWIMEDSFTYCLGYRLDTAKLPVISVTYDGGSESDQFVGDYGTKRYKELQPITYAEFHAMDIDADGNIVVPRAYNLCQKVWRGLSITNGKDVTRRIVGLLRPNDTNANLTLILDTPLTMNDGLANWRVVSTDRTQIGEIGVSLDRVTIKTYIDVPGDPEACEVLSCVMRHIMKQARLTLMDNGINVPTYQYSAIGRNDSYAGQNVWTAEFTITGRMYDEWLMSTSSTIDKITLKTEGCCTEEI